jgi:hypothetical protein
LTRFRWLTPVLLWILLFQQSVPVYASYQCKAIGDIYLSSDIRREELPRLKVHSKQKMDGFDRYFVSSVYASLPWKYAYMDHTPPSKLKVEAELKDGHVLTVKAGENPKFTQPVPDSLKVLESGDPLESFIKTLVFGNNKQQKKAIADFMTWDNWRSYLGEKFWVRDYLQFEVRKVDSKLFFQMKPSVGSFVVYRSAQRPVDVHPWHMQDVGMSMKQALLPLERILGVTEFTKEPIQHRLFRLMQHPNHKLAIVREAFDAGLFNLFMPYFLVADYMRGIQPRKSYSVFRWTVLSYWAVYLLLEMLFFTPSSMSFSHEEEPYEAWSNFWLGEETMLDWYATKSQWDFEKEGVTVIWTGMADKIFWERIGKSLHRKIANLRYAFWNSLSVVLGQPSNNEISEYDKLGILNRHRETLAHVYVHKREPSIFYEFPNGVNRLYESGLSHVFKALLPIIRNVGCDGKEESCGIKNIVTYSHGSMGVLSNIAELFELSKETKNTYTCLNTDGDACRGLPEKAPEVLSQDYISQQIMEGSQFVFLACSVAEGEEGEEALENFAKFFQLEEKQGRVVAARKKVIPLYASYPFDDAHTLQNNPILDLIGSVRKILAYKVTPEARKYNHWDAWDLFYSIWLYGPTMTWKAGKNLVMNGSLSCNEDCVLDLDYRE